MNTMKKFASILLAMILVLAMAVPAMAQIVPEDATVAADKGQIIISNAAKGETYAIHKLFDATVTGTENGSIAYTGTIPESLSQYFVADSAGNITATDAAKNGTEMSDGLRSALTAWVATAAKTAEAVSDGSELKFVNLEYGYYVVTTTQGEQAITVDSTNPTVTIVDKNSSTPNGLVKESDADNDDVNIGDTITYTVTFNTSNYDGAGTAAKKIVSYTIEDTLPEFLSEVTVTSIVVDNDGNAETTDDQKTVTAQFAEKKITLDWYDEENKKFLYDNGATVTITYTATVTDKAAIDGAGNTNKVTVTWITEDGVPSEKKLEENETIYTYAIAIQKVDKDGNALAGAKFQFPFYVKATADEDGAYIYAGVTAEDGLVDELTTPADGVIIVKGVEAETYSITETKAPAGYNKLTVPVSVEAKKTGATTTSSTTTIYYDENGNVTSEVTESKKEVTYTNEDISTTVVLVVNETGVELPSTGGMGTTVLYVVGGALVLAAVIILITKKRMAASK